MNDYDVQDAILSHEHRVRFTWRDWYFNTVPKDAEIPGLGVVNVEATGGGFEDDPWLVVSVETGQGARYFKRTFEGSSFGITGYGTFKEVFPSERVVKEFK